ncbi:MAG: hypothetical protein R3E32_20205 [Chitinophagales bacterium]
MCHNGDYNNTPNTCVGCHQTDFDSTTDPDHSAAGFSTDCATCHNETALQVFDHDNLNFPIYSGEHDGEWSDMDGLPHHPNNFAEFHLTSCHTNPNGQQHTGVGTLPNCVWHVIRQMPIGNRRKF